MTHIELLTAIAQMYGTPRYLEIGVGDGFCFKTIAKYSRTAVAVDVRSNPYGDVAQTVLENPHTSFHTDGSDAFFQANTDVFDLVFIDGDHWSAQVRRDLDNSLKVLAPLGTIALHDTWSQTRDEAAQGSDDAYLVAQEAEADPTLQAFTLPIRPGLTLLRPDAPRFS